MSIDLTATSACECSKGYVARVCRMYNAERNYFAGQLQQHGQAEVGYFFGGGNTGKDILTVNPYSWKYGYP